MENVKEKLCQNKKAIWNDLYERLRSIDTWFGFYSRNVLYSLHFTVVLTIYIINWIKYNNYWLTNHNKADIKGISKNVNKTDCTERLLCTWQLKHSIAKRIADVGNRTTVEVGVMLIIFTNIIFHKAESLNCIVCLSFPSFEDNTIEIWTTLPLPY